MEMKTYKRGRTSDEFKQAAIAAGLSVDDRQYQCGGDWLRFHGSLHGVEIEALFNTINSRVIGTVDGKPFSTDESLDGTPWFDAVLVLANAEE